MPKDLAADCPYLLDFYHTHDFHHGVVYTFQCNNGTSSLAGCPGNLTVLQALKARELTRGKQLFTAPIIRK